MLAARAATLWLAPRAASSARFCAPGSHVFPALARRPVGLSAWRATERGGQARGVRVRRTVVGEDPLLRAPRTRPPPGDPRLVNVLIGANVAVFGMWHLDGISKDWMMRHFTSSLEAFFSGRLHTLLTCAFSHVSMGHLGLNMVGLYFFGPTALASLGNSRFLMLYASAAVVGSLAQLFFEYRDAVRKASAMQNAYGGPRLIHARPSLGASGAVQGVVFYSILARPLIPMLLFFIPMPAWVAGLVMLGMDYFGMQRQQSHVGHAAHLGGALTGAAFWGALG